MLDFPETWVIGPNISRGIDVVVDWMVVNWDPFFSAINVGVLRGLLLPLEKLFKWLPWWIVVAATGLAAWAVVAGRTRTVASLVLASVASVVAVVSVAVLIILSPFQLNLLVFRPDSTLSFVLALALALGGIVVLTRRVASRVIGDEGTTGVVAAVATVIAMTVLGNLGLWDLAMTTLAIVLTSTLLAVGLGLPIGIVAAKSDRFDGTLRPVLDAMQTMPSFVYLIPAIMLFGLGKVPAVMATVLYAIPPIIRLTNLGIRQVDPEVVEAARAFGSTGSQVLLKVQLPMAKPTIMAGVNQTTMMALAMVVIASMIGASGVGIEVLIAINRLEVGRGLLGGTGIVIMAIIIDRISQGLAKSRQRARAT